MIEKVIYRNHLNEVFYFGENGIYINESDLRSYAWSYSTENNKISYFDRGVVTKTLPVVVATADGFEKIDLLMEICEKDVLSKNPGTLIIGDYYLTCYIVSSTKSNYTMQKGYATMSLGVVSDSPAWVRELVRTFTQSGGGEAGKNLDFPHDFAYDFTSPSLVKTLTNTGFADTDFKMVIYGEVTNPAIYINGHLYEVNCYVASGQYLTIDSKEKTIILTVANGEEVNCFKDRNKESYVFEKIAPGEVPVSWAGNFVFDVTLYEERSEPKWT